MGRDEKKQARQDKKKARAERKAARKGRTEDRKVERKTPAPLGKLCQVDAKDLGKAREKLAAGDVAEDQMRRLHDVAVALNEMLLAESSTTWSKLDAVHDALFSWDTPPQSEAPGDASAPAVEADERPALAAPAPSGPPPAPTASAPVFTRPSSAPPRPAPSAPPRSVAPAPTSVAPQPPPRPVPAPSVPPPRPPAAPPVKGPPPGSSPPAEDPRRSAPPPPRGFADDDEHTMAASIDELRRAQQEASALPFEGHNPAPPPVPTDDVHAETMDGDDTLHATSVQLQKVPDTVLPFAGRKPPELPEHLRALKLDHYAALCGEREVYEGWESQVEARYGLRGPEDRDAVDRHFRAIIETNRSIREEFEARREQTRQWALQQRTDGAPQ